METYLISTQSISTKARQRQEKNCLDPKETFTGQFRPGNTPDAVSAFFLCQETAPDGPGSTIPAADGCNCLAPAPNELALRARVKQILRAMLPEDDFLHTYYRFLQGRTGHNEKDFTRCPQPQPQPTRSRTS